MVVFQYLNFKLVIQIVETNDILGSISFKAPDEDGGTDAIH